MIMVVDLRLSSAVCSVQSMDAALLNQRSKVLTKAKHDTAGSKEKPCPRAHYTLHAPHTTTGDDVGC